MPDDLSPALADTGAVLEAIDGLKQQALSATRARAEAADGGVAAGLDQVQVEGYELAMINAELHAARSILDYAAACGATATLEAGLAGAFVAEILPRLRARFD